MPEVTRVILRGSLGEVRPWNCDRTFDILPLSSLVLSTLSAPQPDFVPVPGESAS